jgi:glycosyltransferase involved in cell wall biosynthesis
MPPPDRPGTTQVVVEVTDTLSIGFTTGIQRVLREVLKGLDGPAGEGLDVLPVVAPSMGADFRRLTPDETERLRVHPAGGRAGRRADDFGPLSPLVRRIGDLPLTLRVRARLAAERRRRIEFMPDHHDLSLGPLAAGAIPPGSVFADLEGSWYDPTPRAELLPALRQADVHTMVLVHDVMPLLFPQWFTAPHVQVFRDWLRAHLQHSELFLANSRCTAADLRRVATTLGVDHELDVRVVPLGADHPAAAPRPVPEAQGIGRFLLVVGTLEPRKNQQIVLDAFDGLALEYPDLALVLVGKEGWLVDSLVHRLRHHPMRDDRVRWLGGVDDEQLAWLYEHAFLTVAPSIYEGLGVPVLEAMHHGCATLASSGGAQPEAAAGVAELFEPDDLDGLVALLRRHLDDPAHHDAARAAAAAHRAPTWADTAAVVAASIRELAQVVS